jgi:hypothetical protein
VGIDVTDDRENGVVGAVPVAVEPHELFARECPKPRFLTDAPAPDPVSVVQHFVERLDGHRRGRVPLALGLLDDHLELACELLAVDDRAGVGVELDLQPGHE